jgi:hypothetical protein
MVQAIPISQIVQSTPSVISGGINAGALNGLIVTQNSLAPHATLLSFGLASQVATYFGANSMEAALAANYFNGPDSSTIKPGTLYLSGYATGAQAAWLRSTSQAGTLLASVKALTGSLSMTVDGVSYSTLTVAALANASSFVNAASILTTAIAPFIGTASFATNVMTVTAVTSGALTVGMAITSAGVAAGTTISSLGTGTGGAGTYNLSTSPGTITAQPVVNNGFGGTASFATNIMTVTAAPLAGALTVGAVITSAGVTAGTTITSFGTGTGGVGTYNLSSAPGTIIAQAVTATAGVPPTVTWDSVYSQFVVTSGTTGVASTITQATGTSAAALGLASGYISQGAIADTEAGIMTILAGLSNDWTAFMTVWEPLTASEQAFAAWTSAQGERYVYALWDSDPADITQSNPLAIGSILYALNSDGTIVVYNTPNVAAFVLGYVASINWNATNGRATPAFKTQQGLTSTVHDLPTATALLSNNTNYYGVYSSPGLGNTTYTIFYDGRIAGQWKWLDSYVNQIYLNAQIPLAIFQGLMSVNSAPYNSEGYADLRAWCAAPISQAKDNGTIRAGVQLSASQIATITSQAGLEISSFLQTQGWYLQILPATSAQRAARQSPPVKLWYTDGGAIQSVSVASIAIV